MSLAPPSSPSATTLSSTAPPSSIQLPSVSIPCSFSTLGSLQSYFFLLSFLPPHTPASNNALARPLGNPLPPPLPISSRGNICMVRSGSLQSHNTYLSLSPTPMDQLLFFFFFFFFDLTRSHTFLRSYSIGPPSLTTYTYALPSYSIVALSVVRSTQTGCLQWHPFVI